MCTLHCARKDLKAGETGMGSIKVKRRSINERQVHRLFQLSVILKGLNAIMEILGGIALVFINTATIEKVVGALTQEELIEDPHDFVATHLLDFAQHFSVSSEHFYALYLLSHGLIKLFLVAGLLREKLWSYPAAMCAFGLFIGYQFYRLSHIYSVGLFLLTLFDLFLVALVWHEYKLLVRRRARQ
jgi:uncharacterized membrane protein